MRSNTKAKPHNMTPYVARVEHAYRVIGGTALVLAGCPFCGGSHTHVAAWPGASPDPSREMLAPCSVPGTLLTYQIDRPSAHAARDLVGGGRR